MEKRNAVSIYGCGGTGILMLKRLLNTDQSNLAIVHPAFIDSSHANFGTDVNKSDCYVLDGVDGAGKERSVNYPLIARAIDDVLLSHKPSDMNFIIMSGSGGTGSVFGPKLAEALWNQGKAVILFVIGSTESGKATTNTLDTIYSIHSLGKRAGVVPVVWYDTNEENTRQKEVDLQALVAQRAVLDLYSGLHAYLDSSDILNFARPHISAKLAPQLTLLEVFDRRDDAMEIENPISVAELYGDESMQTGSIVADYNTYGIRTEPGKETLYFLIYVQGLEKLLADLKEKQLSFQQRAASRNKKTSSVLDDRDGDDTDGMHF